jgi:hypothetical protein
MSSTESKKQRPDTAPARKKTSSKKTHKHKFCGKCGKAIVAGNSFCTGCGKKVAGGKKKPSVKHEFAEGMK